MHESSCGSVFAVLECSEDGAPALTDIISMIDTLSACKSAVETASDLDMLLYEPSLEDEAIL